MTIIGSIQREVSESYGVPLKDMLSKKRKKHIVESRQVAMYLARERDKSFPYIGQAFGRDHSTVHYACDTVRKRMESDSEYKERVDAVRQKLRS